LHPLRHVPAFMWQMFHLPLGRWEYPLPARTHGRWVARAGAPLILCFVVPGERFNAALNVVVQATALGLGGSFTSDPVLAGKWRRNKSSNTAALAHFTNPHHRW